MKRVILSASARLFLLTTAVVLFGSACFEGTKGEMGNFTFHDLTSNPTDIFSTEQQLTQAVAVGATLTLAVREDGREITLDAASSSAPDILAVESLSGHRVTLKALASGNARIQVRKGDKEDSLTIRVATPARARFHLYPIGELTADVPGLDVEEIVLTPGARIWGFVEYQDATGAALTGYGAADCQVGDHGAQLNPDTDSDRFTLDAPAELGEVALTCGPSSLTLSVQSPDVARTLEGYNYFTKEFGPDFEEVEPSSTVYLVLLARDVDNRIVQGSAAETVTIEIPEESQPYVQLREETGSPELADLLLDSRAVELMLMGQHRSQIIAHWHGLAATLTFDTDNDATPRRP